MATHNVYGSFCNKLFVGKEIYFKITCVTPVTNVPVLKEKKSPGLGQNKKFFFCVGQISKGLERKKTFLFIQVVVT